MMQRREALLVDAIKNIAPLCPVDNQSGFPKRAKVLGNGGLCNATVARQLGNRGLSGASNAFEDGTPGRVRE